MSAQSDVTSARLAGRLSGLAEAAAVFDAMHKEGVRWEAASFAAVCRALAQCPGVRGRVIWDSLHVVEDRGPTGRLPPDWDVRDEDGNAYVTSCRTREDAEAAKALLEAVADRVRP